MLLFFLEFTSLTPSLKPSSKTLPTMNVLQTYSVLSAALWTLSPLGAHAAETTSATAPAPLPRQDANGNPIRRAPTGHISNYDESKVGNYTLPDPLVLKNGRRVRSADVWLNQRRPEILKLYEDHIYGRVPDRAPKVSFEIAETDSKALEGMAVRKRVIAHFGDNTDGPKVNLLMYLPAKAAKPVPLLVQLSFFANPVAGAVSRDATIISNSLALGYGYASLRYTEIEGDTRTNSVSGVRKLALAAGQSQPAADEWGTISAWAWGASRVLDYLETDRAVDAKRVALIGHSRLGKTVLWAGARDPRFALIFSSCSGEMGASLARRDWGETVDDMAANFPWQFAGNFQKFSGRWSDMPVDSHMLIALNAPRPVFITGGTQDQWADPHGQFLAQVAAGPVYRLLGRQDLGTSKLPPLDSPQISGDLGFHYHTGGHTITSADWTAFLNFAEMHLNPKL